MASYNKKKFHHPLSLIITIEKLILSSIDHSSIRSFNKSHFADSLQFANRREFRPTSFYSRWTGVLTSMDSRNWVTQWLLTDLSFFGTPSYTSILSNPFKLSNAFWALKLHICGDIATGWITISLMKNCDDNVIHDVTFESSIVDKLGCQWRRNARYKFKDSGDEFGYKLAKRIGFTSDRMMPGDAFLVNCNFSIDTIMEERLMDDNKISGQDYILGNYERILRNSLDSDIKIKVKDQIFSVHRLVLRTQSPELNSYFSQESVNFIELTECEPDIFYEILFFIYTGKVNITNPDRVPSLYRAAKQYGPITPLMSKCIDYMKENYTIYTFCDFFSLAVDHNEKELQNQGTNYFTRYAKKIIFTEKWKLFSTKYLRISNELHAKVYNLYVPE